MRGILILCVVSLAYGQTVAAQRQTTTSGRQPSLVYQKDKRPVPDGRLWSRAEKLSDPNDQNKAVDFNIVNVDVRGLEIVKKELNTKYQTMLVVVENKGVRESNQSFLFLQVKGEGMKLVSSGWGGPKLSYGVQVMYSEGSVLPKLKPNEQIKVWFDLTKSKVRFPGEDDFLKGAFANLTPTGAVFWVECVLITEPIVT